MNGAKFRWILLLVLISGVQSLTAQVVPIDKVRDQFFGMDKSQGGALNLYTSLAHADLSKEPVLLAYRGAASAAAAGTANGVRSKLKYFNRGKNELEKAVSLKPLDAEIRFVRLATQLNAPGFLGYKGDMASDKAIIIKTLSVVLPNHPNAYLYQRICEFLLAYAELKPAEKATVNQLIVKFNPKK